MIETAKTRKKNFTYFIGIDVSRNKLDYAVMCGKELLFHQEGKNEPEDILTFVAKLKGLPKFTKAKALFCMEQTGFYCNHLLNTLGKLKANIVLENPIQIKNSLGLVRGKSDKADSIRIATYAQKNNDELKLWVPRRPVVCELMNLNGVRNRLLGVSLALNTPLKEETTFKKNELQKQNTRFCKISTNAVKEDLMNVDLAIGILVESDENLKRLNKLITSVPGVGLITAIQIIICTNEFLDIKCPKKFACYAGVAPFKKESGLVSRKAKVSHHANKKMKALLHLCAVCALRFDEEIKLYYHRKTMTEGKTKMVVINAIRNKLIGRVFSCVNKNRCYIKNYVHINGKTASELESDQS